MIYHDGDIKYDVINGEKKRSILYMMSISTQYAINNAIQYNVIILTNIKRDSNVMVFPISFCRIPRSAWPASASSNRRTPFRIRFSRGRVEENGVVEKTTNCPAGIRRENF